MIKIIGFDSPKHRVTCKCRAILEYQNIDIGNSIHVCRPFNERETVYFIVCPNCKQNVYVEEP